MNRDFNRLARIAFAAAFIISGGSHASCSDDDPVQQATTTQGGGQTSTGNTTDDTGAGDEANGNDNDTTAIMDNKITITAGGMTYAATLDDNTAARQFAAMLPLTLDMDELNGNEKYHYLHTPLAPSPVRPGTIHAGDLMLYGSSCVVLFYETFQSGYSYTRLGRIENPASLAQALGKDGAEVTFAHVAGQ